MAKAKKPDTDKTIIDVAHPGKSAPSGNSKSVIVNSRPLLKDPMMRDDNASQRSNPDDSSLSRVSNKSKVDEPLTAPLLENVKPDEAGTPEPPNSPTSEEKTIEPVKDESAPVKEEPSGVKLPGPPETQPSPEPPAATADKADNPNSDTNPVDKSPQPTEPEPSKPEKPDQPEPAATDKAEPAPGLVDKEAQRQAAIDKLAESKKYYLPINAVEKRRSRRFVLLGVLLSLLLIVAWADVALDAGLVTIGANLPHTHYFDQQTVAPAATAPSVAATKSLTTTFSKLTFRYPSDWTINNNDTAQSDLVGITPKLNNDVPANGTIGITFNSPAAPATSGSFIVQAVHYQKLAHQINGTVYLCDLIYKNQSGNIQLVSSLSNSNSDAVGATLSTLDQSFLNADGQTTSQFTINAFRNSAGHTGFTSVAEARSFIQTPNYQKARAMLLSTVVAKS